MSILSLYWGIYCIKICIILNDPAHFVAHKKCQLLPDSKFDSICYLIFSIMVSKLKKKTFNCKSANGNK